MSQVGGARGLPRRLSRRLVPPLEALPLALHVERRGEVAAVRLERVRRRKVGAPASPKHLHPVRVLGDLVQGQAQGLGPRGRLRVAGAGGRLQLLEGQGDGLRAAVSPLGEWRSLQRLVGGFGRRQEPAHQLAVAPEERLRAMTGGRGMSLAGERSSSLGSQRAARWTAENRVAVLGALPAAMPALACQSTSP